MHFNPVEEFAIKPIIHLPELFGIDMSIPKAVIVEWIAAALIFTFFFLAARRAKLVPKGIQNFAEIAVEFVRDGIVLEMMGPHGLPWFPLIATLFFFIVTSNLLGLIPGSFTATSNINVTATFAIMVFLIYHIAGVRAQGPIKYVKNLVPSGVPVFIAPFMFVIEIVSHLARPFSLAVRLFANMTAGHMVILTFLFLIINFQSFVIAPFPLGLALIMNTLELLFSFIQAFIFASLSAMYISGAVEAHH